MNAHVTAGLFDDITLRIRQAVDDLRIAIRDGAVADPVAASELADRMERYADSVEADEAAARDLTLRKA